MQFPDFTNFAVYVLGMSTYTMTEANRRISELVNEARYTGQPVLITDHGKPAVAFISPDLLARYQALEDAADQAVIDQIQARGPRWVDNDDAQPMMNEILAAADADAANQGR
ncbi:MAG: Antitoxin Phd YefM, type toxin-antitoxin system [Kribbellaceae bacterium]|jgi:prevent-host-death family protein|nr:Antitoxin Phd YefM, type toxin-antitoxin system [Kribbellaceae bacterium]